MEEQIRALHEKISEDVRDFDDIFDDIFKPENRQIFLDNEEYIKEIYKIARHIEYRIRFLPKVRKEKI